MNEQPPDDPQTPPTASLKELISKMTAIKEKLDAYQASMPLRELKHIKNEKDMLEKMPFMKKALDLAFENQELITPEFLEKFWEDHAQFLNMKDIYEKSKELNIPHKTTGTTTNG